MLSASLKKTFPSFHAFILRLSLALSVHCSLQDDHNINFNVSIRPQNISVQQFGSMAHGLIVFLHLKVLLSGKSVRSWCDGMSGRSFMVDPLSYFSCNKGRGMSYPVCGMVHIK